MAVQILRRGASAGRRRREKLAGRKGAQPWREVDDRRFSTTVSEGVMTRGGKLKGVQSTKRVKWGKLGAQVGLPVAATGAAVGGAKLHSDRQQLNAAASPKPPAPPKPPRVGADPVAKALLPRGIKDPVAKSARPASVEGKKDLPKGIRYRDLRYDDIEARARSLPNPKGALIDVATGQDPLSAAATATRGGGRSRGEVVAEVPRGAGPKQIGRHVGVRERSFVKPGQAKKGQSDSRFRVKRRSEKEQRNDRVAGGVKGAGLVAAGGAVAGLRNKKIREFVSGVNAERKKMPGADKVARVPGVKLAEGVGRQVFRKPGRYAAGLAAAGGVVGAAGALRKPDTHKIVFD